MHPETRSVAAGARPSPFQIWLRTGRRVAPDSSPARIEFKFNPWHDPDDGRFTFARTGRYFPQGGGSFGGAGASGSWTGHERLSPRNPRNHSIHVVEEGDTLTRIAASRQGLRVSDLVWLNGLQDPNRLRIGQRLMLPTQAYLDEGRRARTNLLNLAFYRRRTADGCRPIWQGCRASKSSSTRIGGEKRRTATRSRSTCSSGPEGPEAH